MSNDNVLILEAALAALNEQQPAAIVTVMAAQGSTPRSHSARMLVRPDGSIVGTVGGGAIEARAIHEALDAIAQGQPRELHYNLVDEKRGDPGICGGEMRLYVDVFLPQPSLLIVGGGHVGQAVAELGAFLGYQIMVVDERPEILSQERFPWARQRLVGDPVEVIRDLVVPANTHVVLVTPHYSVDDKILALLAGRSLPYVGLIGSRRRTAITFENARASGVEEEFLQAVHSPIGLDIGAETPREIAVSILAEIIALRRNRLAAAS